MRVDGALARASTPLIGLTAFGVHATRFAGPEFVLDDAWISFRVARNGLEHGVLSYDLDLAVEGATNLSWTLASAIWIAFAPAHDPIGPARVLGGFAYLLSILVVSSTAAVLAARHGGDERLAAGLSALWMGASGTLIFHSMAGLETGAWILLFAISVRLWVELRFPSERPRLGPALGLGCSLAALTATRPEGVLVAGLLGIAIMRSPQPRSVRLGPLAIVALGLVALAVFRHRVYGSFVPNTFHAKPPDPLAGLRYAGSYMIWGLGLFAWVAAVPAWRCCTSTRWLLLCAGLLAAGTVWSGGDWMPGHRRFALTSVALAIACAVGTSVVHAGLRRRVAVLALGTAVGASVVSAMRGKDAAAYSPHGMSALASMVAETPGATQVALVDVGRFGWVHRGRVLDLAGLTDRHIARLPGGHLEKWDAAYFHARAPEIAFAFVDTRDTNVNPFTSPMRMRSPVEDCMVRALLAGEHYRLHGSVQYAARIHVLVFARHELDLPAPTWGEPIPEPTRAAFATTFPPDPARCPT